MEIGAGPLTRRLAWICVRLRYIVVLAWIAGAAAATLFLPSLGQAGEDPLSGLLPRDAQAVKAHTVAARLFDIPILGETAVVQRSPQGLSPTTQRRVLERAAAVGKGAPPPLDRIAFALPVTNAYGRFPGARERSTTAITWLFFPAGTSLADQVALAHSYLAEIPPAESPVGVTGPGPARLAEFDAINDGLPWVTGATVVAIALLLAVTYRSLVAPLVTLLAAGVAYLVAIRSIAWAGQAAGVSIPSDVEPLVVVLLLGISTDYAIFLLSGMRDRLRAGDPRLAAAEGSLAHNGPIVLTAGLIVAAGTASLLAGRLEFFRAFGPGMALSAVVGLAVALTLIPALLAILGRRTFWPGRAAVSVPSGAPGRLARGLVRRPVAAAVGLMAVALLAAAGTGIAQTNLGLTLIRGLAPGSEARVAELAASQGFSPGVIAPTELIVEQPGIGSRTNALVRLEGLLARQPGVSGVIGPAEAPAQTPRGVVVGRNGDSARYALVLDDPALGGEAIDTLRTLRSRIPSLLARAGLPGAGFLVGGDTALAEETVDATVHDVARIGLAALAVNLVLLVLFLRSLVAPLLLLASSLLALAATLGLTTYVFQGVLHHDELTSYVPFAAAVLLVSLGSDYNVFLAGRIRNEALRRPLRPAIATAVPAASRAISVAGITLAVSFGLLAIVPLRAFRELALTLSLGVLLDAFIVRSVLVPALIALAGNVSWWPGRPHRAAESVPPRTTPVNDAAAAPVRTREETTV